MKIMQGLFLFIVEGVLFSQLIGRTTRKQTSSVLSSLTIDLKIDPIDFEVLNNNVISLGFCSAGFSRRPLNEDFF